MSNRSALKFVSIGSTLAAAMIVTACSSAGASPPPATSANGDIAATLSEWRIDLSPPTAAARNVVFEVTNQGSIPHEFLVIRTDMMADSLPVRESMIDVNAMGGAMDTGMNMPGMSPAGGMEHPTGTVGLIESVDAGATARLALDGLAPGHYAIVCDIAGHYGQGMHADFTVGP